MLDVDSRWKWLKGLPTDMKHHLPTLRWIGSQCDHVTEFGLRSGTSTKAFMLGFPQKIVSYDIDESIDQAQNHKWAKVCDVNWEPVFKSTLEVDIAPTEALLVDTDHNYDQVKAELIRHKDKVSKFIAFHDVWTYSEIQPAIKEELPQDEWDILFASPFCHGMWVFKRKED